MRPKLVVGIGNILLRDEGVGVRVVEAMQAIGLPDDAELLDGGTSGADLLDFVADRQKLIVVDAVRGDLAPGTILRLRAEDLIPEDEAPLSLHQLGLVETLHMARQLGCYPREVVVLGIQPGDISPGLELTDAVARAVPRVIELVLAELAG